MGKTVGSLALALSLLLLAGLLMADVTLRVVLVSLVNFFSTQRRSSIIWI